MSQSSRPLGGLALRFFALVSLAGLAACASDPNLTAPQYRAATSLVDQLNRCRSGSGSIYGASSYQDYVGRVRNVARGCGVRDATLDQAFYATGTIAAADEDGHRSSWAERQLAAAPRGGDYRFARVNPVRKYVEDRVDQLALNGNNLLQQHQALLRQVQERYGVPAEYIVAFWGVETNFGSFTGNHDVIHTLAQLGFSSRRSAFFTEELLGALIILDHGLVNRATFKGSYAGAFGHAQFMPTSYIQHAVDHDGDGRADLYGSLPDAFASIANYVRQRGRWDTTADTAILEVRLPSGFPYHHATIENRRDVSQWSALGVTDAHGRALPAHLGQTAIHMPAGCNGPAFMVTQNFFSIMDYNPEIKYAMAVSQVAETLRRGEYRIVKAWPREVPLTQAQQARLQALLSRRGYGDLKTDGVAGRDTRAAVRRAQMASRLCPDGYATATLLGRLAPPAKRAAKKRR
jgi:membrane-bound lytic murein transglycosylase B